MQDYEFTNSVPYLLNRAGMAIGVRFTERIRSHGISLPMYRVLAVLRQTGCKNLGELSSMVSKGQSSLSRIIGNMQKKGLVTRVRPLDNARLVEIDLTTAGEVLADELMPIAIHFENVISEPMSEDQIKMLKSMLRQIYGQISKL